MSAFWESNPIVHCHSPTEAYSNGIVSQLNIIRGLQLDVQAI